jgi:hypothetical protein
MAIISKKAGSDEGPLFFMCSAAEILLASAKDEIYTSSIYWCGGG